MWAEWRDARTGLPLKRALTVGDDGALEWGELADARDFPPHIARRHREDWARVGAKLGTKGSK